MKSALIIHGMPSEDEYRSNDFPSPSNSHWLPWLQKELLKRGIIAQTPEMPAPFLPEYRLWEQVLGQFLIGEETILIGHSCGAGFLVRWLSEHPINVKKLVLVAPWIDPNNMIGNDFFDFSVNPEVVSKTPVAVLYSVDDDVEGVAKTVETLQEAWPSADFSCYEHFGHFTLGDMGSDKFPELLEIVTSD